MIELPEPKIERNEITLRLGVKSSLSKIKEFLGTYIAFYLLYDDISTLNYSIAEGSSIRIKEDILSDLDEFFQEQLNISNIESIEDKINQSPFFQDQIEPLQVALELYWKLGKISLLNDIPPSRERSGGERYPKIINFSLYIDIVKNILTDSNNDVYIDTKNILFSWITDLDIDVNKILEKKLFETLTIFSEETQVKIKANNSDLIFQQESIYKGLISGNEVDSKGEAGAVGPYRIMRKFTSSLFHPYIKNNGTIFSLKDDIDINSLSKYTEKVSTYLDLITRRTIIEHDCVEDSNQTNVENFDTILGNNLIYFGSPGTGKSYAVNEVTKSMNVRRVTFHPEYDYSSFVGGYKPSMNGSVIEYKFVPQIFTNIYVEAWKNSNRHYYLQIEEINRGNCAEIFGDLFQLLDRKDDGSSEYSVDASEDLYKYLLEHLGADHEGIKDAKIKLPSNLSIIATMNTSDQSLFPMDSAFKRRWNWKYIPIDYRGDTPSSNFKIKLNNGNTYSWLQFLKQVNKKIVDATESQDKQIGNWFVKPIANVIDEETFINKVLFYLWNDVFKDEEEINIFILNESETIRKVTYEEFFSDNEDSSLIVQIMEQNLGLNSEDTH